MIIIDSFMNVFLFCYLLLFNFYFTAITHMLGMLTAFFIT